MVEKVLLSTIKSFDTPSILKLCACLQFFSEGGYQKRVARDYEVGMAQSTFCIVLSQVLDALEQQICRKCITYLTEEKSSVLSGKPNVRVLPSPSIDSLIPTSSYMNCSFAERHLD